MANEIDLTMKLMATKGTLKHVFQPSLIEMTMSGSIVYDSVHSIGTTEESVSSFGDIGTEGVIVVYNQDATNYCQVGFATTVYGMRLKASGIPAVFYAEPGLTLYLKANTAACNVRIICYEA